MYGICWNPYEVRRVQLAGKDGKARSKKVYLSFVTYGRRHIKFWSWQKRVGQPAEAAPDLAGQLDARPASSVAQPRSVALSTCALTYP